MSVATLVEMFKSWHHFNLMFHLGWSCNCTTAQKRGASIHIICVSDKPISFTIMPVLSYLNLTESVYTHPWPPTSWIYACSESGNPRVASPGLLLSNGCWNWCIGVLRHENHLLQIWRVMQWIPVVLQYPALSMVCILVAQIGRNMWDRCRCWNRRTKQQEMGNSV